LSLRNKPGQSAIRSPRYSEVRRRLLCNHSRQLLPGDQPGEARQWPRTSRLASGKIRQKRLPSACFEKSCRVLTQVISSLIKFHIEKIQIRFALLGDEWLYIKLQASLFSSCIDEVSCCACG
jgi:hypothetical protein